jgi:iron only hydrogenase large subunit-like protein
MKERLEHFFKEKLGAQVIDLGPFGEMALRLSYQEWKERYLASKKHTGEPAKKGMKYNSDIGYLPILSSECPGWVCYAEKTIGEEAFPFMSKIKSP